jgi:HEAT repeat protein
MAPPTSIAAELRGSIGTFISQITNLLEDDSRKVRAAGVEVLSKLSEQGMQHIWNGMAPPTSIAAEFRESIGIFILQIAGLLEDNQPSVRMAAAEALSKLSERGM